jgi:hypothetical protein
MGGIGAVFLYLATSWATAQEVDCRASADDYDASECDGLAHHLRTVTPYTKGTLTHALATAARCETPTSWAEVDRRSGGEYWYAVCGTADGRVCGVDVSWTHCDCENSTMWQPTDDVTPATEECNEFP